MWCTLDYGNGQERVKSFAVYPSSATKHNRTWRMLGWPCEIWYISISLNTLPLECPTHLSMILTANSWSFKKESKMVTHYMYAVFGEFLSDPKETNFVHLYDFRHFFCQLVRLSFFFSSLREAISSNESANQHWFLSSIRSSWFNTIHSFGTPDTFP